MLNNPSFKIGDLVKSRAGHDEGRIFIVIEVLDKDFVKIADENYRLLSNPKLKRAKHLKFLSSTNMPGSPKNTDIKRLIKQFVKNQI
ncbi:MAG: KOW domain-containing RNA-binding protein [Firmicutes bacterium]|nr:KOW domain-containing RNA-binding protein [Bacillota bacterium]